MALLWWLINCIPINLFSSQKLSIRDKYWGYWDLFIRTRSQPFRIPIFLNFEDCQPYCPYVWTHLHYTFGTHKRNNNSRSTWPPTPLCSHYNPNILIKSQPLHFLSDNWNHFVVRCSDNLVSNFDLHPFKFVFVHVVCKSVSTRFLFYKQHFYKQL